MKKQFRIILAVLAASAMLTGCNSGSNLKNSTYIDINGIYNNAADYRSDPDAALDAVIGEQNIEPAERITLNDGTFSIKENLSANYAVTWDGTYTLENQILKLHYDSMSGGGQDQPDTSGSRIPALNETGAYPAQIMPQFYLVDSARTIGARLPICLLRVKESPSVLEQHGDFLCVPYYGFTLDGSYKSGSDFAVDYVPEKTLRDDRFSEAYYNEADRTFADQPDEDRIASRLRILANRYGVENDGNMQFRLAFSGEKWVMTASDGSEIGKGGYKESSKHPGLIAMFAEPDDPNVSRMIEDIRPLFLYIENDAVYYPGLVRT